jgi:hypothetical protein
MQDPQRQAEEKAEEDKVTHTFKLAAQYIALSFALQPAREVYQRSLKVLQSLLPYGQLRAGYLVSMVPSGGTCHER